MSTTMEEKPVSGSSQINPLGHLTRQQLKELEQKEKHAVRKSWTSLLCCFRLSAVLSLLSSTGRSQTEVQTAILTPMCGQWQPL